MNVRLATSEDLASIQELYKEERFHDFERFDVVFDSKRVTEVIKSSIEQEALICCEVDGMIVGGLAGNIVQSTYTTDILFMTAFFYIKEGYKMLTGKFLSEVEELLKYSKVTRLVIASPNLGKQNILERFYKIMGFKPFETLFVKAV